MEQLKLSAPLSLMARSFGILRDHFLTIVAILSPLLVVNAFYTYYLQSLPAEASAFNLIHFSRLLAIVIIGTLTNSALLHSLHFGNLGARESYSQVSARYFNYLWVTVLVFLVLLGGYGLLILPGVFVAVVVPFALVSAVGEGERGLNAILRSFAYIRGRWWQVFFRFLVLGLALSIFSFVLNLMLIGLSPWLAVVVELLTSTLTLPIGIIYIYLLYSDLKLSSSPSIEMPRAWPWLVLALLGALFLLALGASLFLL